PINIDLLRPLRPLRLNSGSGGKIFFLLRCPWSSWFPIWLLTSDFYGTSNGTASILNVSGPWYGGTPFLPPRREKATSSHRGALRALLDLLTPIPQPNSA